MTQHVGAPLREVMAHFQALARNAPSEEEVAAQEREAAAEARAARGATYAQMFAASLPPGYAHCVEDPLEPTPGLTPAIEAAERMTRGRSLFLHGPPGTGKTHLAISTAARLSRDEGLKPHFWSWPELLTRLRDFRNTERMPSIGEADILIADDLDKGGETSFVYERVYDLMQRVFDGKITIVTSNHSPAETAIRFGMGDSENTAALASRFRLFDVVKVNGKDRRDGRDRRR